MSIKQFIQQLVAAPRQHRIKKQVIDLQLATDALIRRDIADWRRAWQLAINVDNPDRRALYDIYRDVEADLHLSGCVAQRTGFVMARPFKLTDAKGVEQPDAHHYFDQEWFKQLCAYTLQSIYWGHSLIQLGDLTTDGDGCPCLTGVTLIPRKHVVPEHRRILPQQGLQWTSGIDYTDPALSRWLIEAGQPDDLGLYLKAAMQTIPKKNMLAFWDSFGEIFGMPMRVIKTNTRDEKEQNRILDMADTMGNKQTVLLNQDTDIQFVESTRGDAYQVYNQRVDRANSELSKLIIGQTMTIEDGSSLSQSQTHLEVFQNLVDKDADMLRDVINNQLLPRLVALGFPLQGLRFEWDDSETYTPEQQVAYERLMLEHFEVDQKYFEEKYGIKILGKKQSPMSPMGGEEEQLQHNLPPFKGGQGGSSFFD